MYVDEKYYIPLNIAYLDSSGKILEIYDMVPLSDESVCSKKELGML